MKGCSYQSKQIDQVSRQTRGWISFQGKNQFNKSYNILWNCLQMMNADSGNQYLMHLEGRTLYNARPGEKSISSRIGLNCFRVGWILSWPRPLSIIQIHAMICISQFNWANNFMWLNDGRILMNQMEAEWKKYEWTPFRPINSTRINAKLSEKTGRNHAKFIFILWRHCCITWFQII